MVDIVPFKGLVFNNDIIKNIEYVISPPYDVIDKDKRNELLIKNPYNIVHLILPEGEGLEKYKNAKNLLDKWTGSHVLNYDNEENLYVLEINYSSQEICKTITGFIGLSRIEPYDTKKILRHEKTLSKPREDRLNLLRSCKTNFGLIYTLYNDQGQNITMILEEVKKNNPLYSIPSGYDENLSFRFWKINDKYKIEKIQKLMKEKVLIIADGHHRYETSLLYKQENQICTDVWESNLRSKSLFKPEDYILTLYVYSRQKDIEIFPTFRLVNFKRFPGLDKIIKITKNDFDIIIKNEISIKDTFADARKKGLRQFIFYSNHKYAILKLKTSPSGINYENIKFSQKSLDLEILHDFLLKIINNIYQITNIEFTHSVEEITKKINNKTFDMGIFVNAPTIKEMEEICLSGNLMPQKSTFFFPKPCTGLVMYRIDK